MASEVLAQLVAGLGASGPDRTAPPPQARADFDALLATLRVADDIAFEQFESRGSLSRASVAT